jgi:hypothetical protein
MTIKNVTIQFLFYNVKFSQFINHTEDTKKRGPGWLNELGSWIT